jgi:hypothetical protein
LIYLNGVPANCSDADPDRARKLAFVDQFVEMCALESAASFDFWPTQNAAVCFGAFSRHPETSVATCHGARSLPFVAATGDKEWEMPAIDLLHARWAAIC